MKIFYTTEDFVYKGRPWPGIPFLCNDDMEIVPAVTDYLLWLALENAYTESRATWKSHAEGLYDYFSWLSANELEWDALPKKGPYGEEISNLATYRNWSEDLTDPATGKHRIASSTIRKRLTQIMSFYQWALRRRRIAALPWERLLKRTTIRESHPSMYRHTRAARETLRDNLRPKVPKKPIRFLQLNQCRSLLDACGTQTLRLMTKLMLQTGLRNEECRTFPRKYIFDPSNQVPSKRIAIELSPIDMAIKGNKPRRIYISRQLMKDLFDYLNLGEGAHRSKIYRRNFREKSPFTFLNQDGMPWSEKGLNNAYRKLWAPDNNKPLLPFRITPHMLRHTFATFELSAESQRENLATALTWVRDRLGHTSIASTTIYVHCLDLIGERDLNMYQLEIDALLAETAHG
ncbi:tyrosine-type recombinase/integrase [Burkholderia sp. Tr-20390]|uniref:tyrosine-type recombinase/integrase n=1 Tax=Burkholderia sp. Tr-20390 TaxID=2703904 RepID=UPI00197E23DB|nr:tyrosine-type recombinase/integrase [Burkholderia sp. Tr-20390]